jgi:tetratricopeptide (TPR) repeat protein
MAVNAVLIGLACWLLWWRFQVKKFQETVQGVQEACLRGEYEKGLKLAEDLKQRRSTPPPYFLLRGEMLYQLGKLTEAESCIQTGLNLETEARQKAVAREALGRVLTEMKRYDDAIACLEASVQDCPDLATGHRAIAEVYLRQGIRAADALGSARLAVKLASTGRADSKQLQDLNLSEAQATLAWAVAAHAGDAEEVDRLLANAFLLCGEEYRPIRAHLNCLAAAAYVALGTPSARGKSAGHLQLASIGDSVGNFGRRARAGIGLEAAV